MHAVDRKALIEGAYSGFGQPIGSFFSPNNPAFVDMTNVIPYDVEKAKALLKEAGYGNGLSITIKTPADGLCQPLGGTPLRHAVGGRRRAEDHPDRVPGQVDRGGVQEQGLRHHHRRPTRSRSTSISSPATATTSITRTTSSRPLIAEAAKTTDEKARFAKYAEAQKILAEDVPALFLFQLPKLGVWNAKVQGLWENSPIPSNDVTEVSWSE